MIVSGEDILGGGGIGGRKRFQGVGLLGSDFIFELLAANLKDFVLAVVELIKENAAPDKAQRGQ